MSVEMVYQCFDTSKHHYYKSQHHFDITVPIDGSHEGLYATTRQPKLTHFLGLH